MIHWRPLSPNDIDALMQVASTVHPSLPETPQIFLERITLYPEGCLALVDTDGQFSGYAISHPICQGQPPALDTLLGEIPPNADQYYIHDVAIVPRLRGRALAATGIERVLKVASRHCYPTTCLISVYGTESFWRRFGFIPPPVGGSMGEKLKGYGEDAVYLLRENEIEERVAQY